MKTISTILALAALLISFAADAEFRTTDRAYEVAFADLRIPGVSSGDLAFRSCSDCELVTLRVTPQTRYIFDGEALDLRAFRRAYVRSRRANIEKPVIVKHNLETDTVVSVTVNL